MDGPIRLPRQKPPVLSLNHFVGIMIVVIAIQGTYLGYFVGILTTVERRFGISSERSGLLLSLYDIGHTVSILVVGYIGTHRHLPRITGIGVLLSAFSMFLLALPVAFYGTVTHDGDVLLRHKEMYALESKCDPYRDISSEGEDCKKEHNEHTVAYVLLSLGQVLAGVFAAPFNTLAYVYIDTNVDDRRRSPLLLGLLTSMYAFGPALGFALSSGLTRVYTTLGSPPPHVSPSDDHWVGAWWLGFIICGILYLFCAIPFFFFPKSYRLSNDHHPDSVPLRPHLDPIYNDETEKRGWDRTVEAVKGFGWVLWDLARNPVYVSMVVAWMFGSYLIGGYQTYLPKYIETQYGRSASAADMYAGFISIGAVATSTALGGWILTRWDVPPRRAILLLLMSWIIIVIAYVLGIFVGCEQADIQGLQQNEDTSRWSFGDHYSSPYSQSSSCSADCRCDSVFRFDAVNFDGMNFFSPCHAGCNEYDIYSDTWSSCMCAMDGPVEKGLLTGRCSALFLYLGIMFIGLFAGNLFFMVTMMIVLRSVYDDEKVMALSLASCVTNLLGFIPAPVIFGWIIDKSCILWNSRCPHDSGNCVVYDNGSLRFDFHLGNAVLQTLAVVFVGVCYLVSLRVKLPEEETDHEDDVQLEQLPPQKPTKRVTDF